MIKHAINNYYKKLYELWIEKRGVPPRVPFNDKMPVKMYITEKSESNYISWKIIENENNVNFDDISKDLGFELHEDIKDYLTSYFFLSMEGILDGIIVYMTPITPLTDIRKFLNNRNKIALEVGRNNKDIEIGYVEISGADNLLLCVNNYTGEVKWLDVEMGKNGIISSTLYDLIDQMEPRC